MAGPGLAGIVDITDICRALLDALQAAQQPPPDPRPPAGRHLTPTSFDHETQTAGRPHRKQITESGRLWDSSA